MSLPALYRSSAADDWQEVDLLGRHKSGGYVVRERARAYAGVLLASVDQVRFCGSTFEPFDERANEGMRRYWRDRRRPPMTPHQLYEYRLLYPLVGRDAALAQLGIASQ